ncbi:MAG: DMT family transporter [Candidatus Hodarchaeales archaeon]
MKKAEFRYEYYIYILLFLTMIIWGGTWPVGRWLVTDTAGPTIPQLMISSIRYVIVTVIFLFLLLLKEKSIHLEFLKKNFIEIFFMGLFLIPIYQIGYVYGNTFTSASDASVIFSTSPLWVVIIGFLFFKYKISLKILIGPLLGILGVGLIANFSPDNNVENKILGDLLIIIAAIAYAFYTILLNKTLKKSHPQPPSTLVILTWVFVVGTFLLVPFSIFLSPEYLGIESYLIIPERIWYGIIYLAVFATVWGFLLYAEAVNRLNATRVIVFLNLIPIFGILLSSLWLGEKLDILVHTISLVIILLGVAIVNTKSKNSDVIS